MTVQVEHSSFLLGFSSTADVHLSVATLLCKFKTSATKVVAAKCVKGNKVNL
jgi:hypothetical protein